MHIESVREIAIDESGRLLLAPEVSSPIYPFIYRAGNGLRWDSARKAFVAFEPQRWVHEELLSHIRATVREEFGVVLSLTSATRWVNVPVELQETAHEIFNAEGE